MKWRTKVTSKGGARDNRDMGNSPPMPSIIIQQSPPPEPAKRDWVQIIVTALPGMAAIVALFLTYQSLNSQIQENKQQLQSSANQLAVQNQGQITDRFNAAVTNLGSSAIDVRIGGVYALQRIMTDSHRDQPAIVDILSAYIRTHSPAAPRPIELNGVVSPPTPGAEVAGGRLVTAGDDVQAALTVIGERNPSYDGSSVVDLTNANISGANLGGLNFTKAEFFGSDLIGANLTQAHLEGADFEEADLEDSLFFQADLVDAQFSAASLVKANLRESNLAGSDFASVTYEGLKLSSANLADSDFDGSALKGADFEGVNIRGVDGLSAAPPGQPAALADPRKTRAGDMG